MPDQESKPIGKIVHYFGKIGVAIIELADGLKVGDKVKIAGPTGEFEQTIDSLEIDRNKIQEAAAGQVIGVKVSQKAKEGSAIFKV